MAKNAVAKLFRNGRSQAVRLPREFRFEGDRVRIRRTDQGVLLEPLISDAAKWFEELDRFDQERFMVKGRHNQPITFDRKLSRSTESDWKPFLLGRSICFLDRKSVV